MHCRLGGYSGLGLPDAWKPTEVIEVTLYHCVLPVCSTDPPSPMQHLYSERICDTPSHQTQ